MKMTKDMIKNTNIANIPTILKDYLLRNQHIPLFLNEELLAAMEDLYTEYMSLYTFDEAEFSAYIITELKKYETHDCFYSHLKAIMASNLKTISKHELSDDEPLVKIGENISNLNEDHIPKLIKELIYSIDSFKVEKNIQALFVAFRLSGSLYTLFKIYPANAYYDDFRKAYNRLDELSFEI